MLPISGYQDKPSATDEGAVTFELITNLKTAKALGLAVPLGIFSLPTR